MWNVPNVPNVLNVPNVPNVLNVPIVATALVVTVLTAIASVATDPSVDVPNINLKSPLMSGIKGDFFNKKGLPCKRF
jgi:hypothetical protein